MTAVNQQATITNYQPAKNLLTVIELTLLDPPNPELKYTRGLRGLFIGYFI